MSSLFISGEQELLELSVATTEFLIESQQADDELL